MFNSAAGWHCSLLRFSVGAHPVIRPGFSCLLSCRQAGPALLSAHFPFCALKAMPCAHYHVGGKQVKPLFTPASLVDTVFPLFSCI